MNASYIRSDRLCIGGLTFTFPDSIAWPTKGPLSCYTSFLSEPSGPITDDDVIRVSMHDTLPSPDDRQIDCMDSGDGIVWATSANIHIVRKVLSASSPSPLWELHMNLDANTADIYFSKTYMDGEILDGGWPVGAPRYQIDQHLVMQFLSSRQGALIHSAGINYHGNGFMCSGVSTAGKTTISRLLSEHGDFDILTDDRVVLRCGNQNDVIMHGTPWTGEGRYATADVAPLKAMFFLKKDNDIRAQRLSVADAVNRMLPVTSVPWFDEELMTLTLKTLEKVAQSVPAYDLHFPKSPETPAFIAQMMDEI